ncbi:MAG: histone deacetylase family protein [Gammaproteobacteria bacterium]|nr:histone deacetylase family protein [Gammaproteobacteria bacterium]
MQVVYSDRHHNHSPEHFLIHGARRANPEVPGRADALLTAVRNAGHELVEPRDYGPEPRAAVHTPEYLKFLTGIYQRWQQIEGASPEVVPNVHPNGRGGGYPDAPAGQAGFHMADTSCPISAGTWPAACASANCAAHAAALVAEGAGAAYALCRPPGHHAFADMAGGFCYLNNSAIAAQQLRRLASRVAILDVDVHHGNGTQGIFYRRADVMTVSLHADPAVFYPFFWGYAEERGEEEGDGYNFNLPLSRGTGDNAYLAALDTSLQRIRAFSPEFLVVALGLDAFEGDPFRGLSVSRSGFARIGEAVGRLGLPTVLIQEGGYLTAELGANLIAWLGGFESVR